MSKRDESGPEYMLLELQDTMAPAWSYCYYTKHEHLSPDDIEKIFDPASDWALFTGHLSEGWTSLSDNRQAKQIFTREHWCEVLTIDNE